MFAGKVVRLYIPPRRSIGSADPVNVTFRVDAVWKGPMQNILRVTTAREGISCGYSFEMGVEYLVYARGIATELRVSKCSRTQQLPASDEDLVALGEGIAPPDSPPFLRMLGLGAILAGLIFMVIK